jgi:hypothetical protein
MPKLTHWFALGALVTSCSASSSVASAQEPLMTDRPMGDFSAERLSANQTLLFGGGMLFLGAYGTSTLIGTLNDRKADKLLAVPLAGPWLDLGDRSCERVACNHEALSTALLIASGVLQGVGLAGVISSFFVAEDRFELPRAGAVRAATAPRLRLTPAPLGSQGTSQGLALVGTF